MEASTVTSGAGTGAPPPVYTTAERKAWTFADYQAEPLTFFLEPYRRYGPVFQVVFDGVPTNVMAGPEANEFYMLNRELWVYRKAFAFISYVIERDLITLDGKDHAAKRQRMQPSFRHDVLQHRTADMQRALVDLLEEVDGKEVDLRWLMNISFFRQSSNALGMKLPDDVFADVLEAEQYLLEGTAYDSPDSPLAQKFSVAFERAKAKVKPYAEECLADPTSASMLAVMARSHKPESEPNFSVDELIEDAVVLLEAGVENGAHIILWALLYLLTDRELAQRVRAELRGLAPESELSPAEAPLLNATVLEAERIRPPFPFLPRATVRDFELGGRRVAADQPLLHAITLVHFLEEVYPDPFSFRPERHLTIHHPAKLHAAFGMGPHRCIGLPQARVQAAQTIAELMKNWNVELLFEPSMRYRMTSAVTPIEDTLPVMVTRRRRDG